MSTMRSSGDERDCIESCCCEKYKYDIGPYGECCRNYFGRCKEYWRCSCCCCCGWNKYDDKGQCNDEEECSDKGESHDKECDDKLDEICIPKSYLPVPCVYPVQCLVVCKNARYEHFRIYVNDLLGFSLKFKIKESPHKGIVRLDPNHTGRGSYTPHYDTLGFDSFVVTVFSMYDHEIIHSVDTTIRVRIQSCEIPGVCDLNCDCCIPCKNHEA